MNSLETDGRLERTSSPLNYNSAYTLMCWVKINTDRNTYQNIFGLIGGAWDTYVNSDFLGTNNDGTTSRIISYSGGSGAALTGNTLYSGWKHIAIVRSSTSSFTAYIGGDGYGGSAINTDVSSRTSVQRECYGVQYSDTYRAAVSISAIKGWQSALSESEIETEKDYGYPQKSGAIHYVSCNASTISAAVVADIGTDLSYYGDCIIEEDAPTITWGGGSSGNPWYIYAQQMRQKLEEKLKRRILIPGFADCMRYGYLR